MKKNLQFDTNGVLMPPQAIQTTLPEVESFFVRNFPLSFTRKKLFANYLAYIEKFSTRISPNFVQWVNGSFVTAKRNPNDIDFVTFLDYRIFEQKQTLLTPFYAYSLETKGLDAYICELYPKNHALYNRLTLYHQKEWLRRFSRTKPDAFAAQVPKGFLKLSFTDENNT